MERAFKGIWIPKEIWLDENLNWVEKILLVEIISLDNEQGCWASNAYFADFFKLSKNRISVLISSLKEKGYITIKLQYKKGTKQIEKRIIRNEYTYMRKQIGGIIENTNTPICENTNTPICENTKDNNTSFNNTFNKDHMSSKPDPVPYVSIIGYLNKVTGKKYKVTQKWKDLIKARWNEGQRLDDFIKVIDGKAKQWLNDEKMAMYLRPQTLFGNKFDEYLNECQETGTQGNWREAEAMRTQRELAEIYGEQS